jgi:CheY-like chemotaxis protein
MAWETILVVEDNEVQREGLAFLLRQAGYAVVAVAGGAEALRLLEAGPPFGQVLLDMMVPGRGGDGWYFLEQRRRAPALARVPVLVMTGLDVAGEEWAASLGATGLLHKPLEVETLLGAVGRCLAPEGRG